MQPLSRFAGAPVVKWLLIANAAIFLLDYGTDPQGPARSGLFAFGNFNIAALQGCQIWRLLTFQFLHADIMHLVFNMFGLYMFGGIVERWWGSKRFVWFYLLSGVGGALLYTFLYFGTDLFSGQSSQSTLVGASAGIFGIFVAVAVIAPNMRIQLLFPPIPMKMRTFALIILGIGAFTLLTRGNNAGGEAGHLGGALLGWLFMKFPDLIPGGDRPKKATGTKKRRYEPKLKPKSKAHKASASQIDAILDKINEHGVHSLTDEERELLKKSSDKS